VNGLKVAFLTEFFQPHVGGCERRFLEIGRRLVTRGHEIHVFTIQYDNHLAKMEIVDGITVHRYAHSKSYISQDSFRSFGGIAKYSFASFAQLLGSNFDVYYSNQWPMLHSFCVKPVAKPLVQEWCEVWDSPFRAVLMQKLLRGIGNYDLAVSEFTRKRLVDILKIDSRRTFVVPNGVDAFKFSGPNEKVWGRIIYAGRLVPHKHVELLVDAFREVKKKVPQAELHIVGSGLSLRSVKDKTAGLKDCFVHGFLPEDQLIELFKSAWLFVLPSEREGSGIAALEAMAAGVPFVTVDYPNNAAKEFCRFKCGILVAPNKAAIASSIIQLFNDEGLWKEMSRNALNVAKEHDWDMIANQMENFFGMVVNESEK
jgi:glycosyltransferase involved in cell wall biosynthesis